MENNHHPEDEVNELPVNQPEIENLDPNTELPTAEELAEEAEQQAEGEASAIEEEETEEETVVAETPAASEQEEEVAASEEDEEADDTIDDIIGTAAKDDYDWGRGKLDIISYSPEERARQLAMYDAALGSIEEMEIVRGTIAHITKGDVFLDLRFKSDGLLSLSEFRDRPELKEGDSIEVYVESKEDKRGQLVLSRRKAKLLRAWENIKLSHSEGKIISGTVVSKTKGGLIVDVDGLETFLPGSQIDVRPITDYDQYVGKKMEFKVVKINEQIKNAVVSHKALIESDLEVQRQEIIASLERGQVLEGTVKNITDFGAFLDLGGVDGLLYITDISWGRISHPTDVLQLSQKLNVVVLDFDDNKKRISLGLKQLLPHPWNTLGEEVVEGSVVNGKIVNIEDYGAFLELVPGVEGLIHISEVTWSNQSVNAREYFKLGAFYDAKVVTIDRDDRKISLSIKQLLGDPWETIEERFVPGTRQTGEVKNITPYGVFVELAEGIGGMIHISDLSWTRRYNHPSEFTKIGEKLDVTVLEIDKESRKLSLGHKQLEENPWDTFENVFPVGSLHEATVIRKDERGALVQMPYGLEAFAPARHIRKDDGTMVEAEETLPFKVIEFNREEKRIVVSHTRHLEDLKREEEEAERRERKVQTDGARQELKKQQSKVEKTTLGEMNAFQMLREQLLAEEEKDKNEDK